MYISTVYIYITVNNVFFYVNLEIQIDFGSAKIENQRGKLRQSAGFGGLQRAEFSCGDPSGSNCVLVNLSVCHCFLFRVHAHESPWCRSVLFFKLFSTCNFWRAQAPFWGGAATRPAGDALVSPEILIIWREVSDGSSSLGTRWVLSWLPLTRFAVATDNNLQFWTRRKKKKSSVPVGGFLSACGCREKISLALV